MSEKTVKQWKLDLDKIEEDFKRMIPTVLSRSAERIIRRSQTHYLTGGSLNVRTGRLRAGVRKKPAKGAKRSGNMYSVELGVSTPKYGAAWEFGFTVPAYTITPKTKKVLKFAVDGKDVFAKRVNIPGRTEPARPWLRPAIEDKSPEMLGDFKKAGIKILKGESE